MWTPTVHQPPTSCGSNPPREYCRDAGSAVLPSKNFGVGRCPPRVRPQAQAVDQIAQAASARRMKPTQTPPICRLPSYLRHGLLGRLRSGVTDSDARENGRVPYPRGCARPEPSSQRHDRQRQKRTGWPRRSIPARCSRMASRFSGFPGMGNRRWGPAGPQECRTKWTDEQQW